MEGDGVALTLDRRRDYLHHMFPQRWLRTRHSQADQAAKQDQAWIDPRILLRVPAEALRHAAHDDHELLRQCCHSRGNLTRLLPLFLFWRQGPSEHISEERGPMIGPERFNFEQFMNN